VLPLKVELGDSLGDSLGVPDGVALGVPEGDADPLLEID